MADEQKKVEYRFTGDVSSLKAATEGAIKLLDQYQSKINALTKANAYTPNQRVAKSMQTAISGTMKQIEQLQKKFKEVQNIKVFKGSPEANQLSSAMKNLQTQLDSFNSKEKVTTKDVQALVAAMRAAKQSFHDVAPAVDNLVAKEKRFQETLTAIRAKSEEMAQRMRDAFGKVSQPFDGMSSKLESFKAKVAEVMDNTKRVMEAAGSGFRQFKGDAAEAAAGEAAIAEGAAAIDPRLAVAIKAFQTFTKVVKTGAKVFKTAKSGFDSIKKAINSLIPHVDRATSSFGSFKQILGGAALGTAFVEATKSSMAFIENLNLFTVAMGESIDEALKFVDTMSEIYGMDPSNLYRYAGYFNQLTDAIGMSTQASKTISLSLTKASNDIASLFNVEIEQVVNNLASGMQGMSMAVRKYGIDIRQATLAQTALNYGFTENIASTSEANRQALRYLTIMQQVKNATKQVTSTVDGSTEVMGDFARNIETPANQLRILKEQASQVARAFGNFFIPIMQKTLYVINGVLMAIKLLLQFLASLAGIDIGGFGGEISAGADDATSAVGSIGDAADSTAKKLKNLIAPFDELTILSQNTDTGAAGADVGIGSDALDPALAAAIEAMSLGLDDIRMKAMDVRDKILELLGLEFDGSEITVTIGGFIDDLIHLWDNADYTGFGERIAQFLNQGIEWGIQHTDPAKYGPILNQKVSILAQVLNGLVSGFNWEGLGTIIGNGITLALGAANTFLTTFDFTQFGASLATGLNGIVNAVDWELLGETIGNFFMAKVRALTGFFETFDWVNLGTSLANGFMSLLSTIQWDEMGSMVAAKWNGIIDGIRAFWATYEWGTLGSSLAEYFSVAVREINWHNLGAAVSETLRGLLREVTNFLGELDWFSIGKAIMEFILAIDWLGLLEDVVVAVITILGAVVRGLLGMIVGIFTGIGADIAEGFQNGILDGIKNIGTWLWDHLCDPVIRAVKGFFGIHSPSTVFSEIGGYIVEGLFNGITNMASTAATWVKEHLCDPIINGAKSAFGIVGNVASTFKTIGGNLLDGLFSGLGNIGSKVTEWGKGILNKVKGVFDIHSPSKEFEEIGNYMNAGLFKGIEDTKQIQTTYSAMLQAMQESTKTFTDNAAATFKNMADATNVSLNTLKTQHQTVTNNIASMYDTMASRSITKIQSIISTLNTIPRTISTTHTVTTNNVVTNTANNARAMATGGVVRGPTYALIGEGIYDEAVIPLGDSPELADMIDRIAQAVSGAPRGGNSDVPVEVHVYIDSEEVTTRQNRANRMYGRTQQNL